MEEYLTILSVFLCKVDGGRENGEKGNRDGDWVWRELETGEN